MASALEILVSDPSSHARAGLLHTAHGDVRTPAFVPLATKASVRGLLPAEVSDLGYDIVLGNTFHLHLNPGDERIAALGGLHEFMRWDGPIITDSGGFQVFSMGHGTVADEIKGRAPSGPERAGKVLGIEEDGVSYRSYVDGSTRFMGPEDSMQIQANLGSDIALVFDECTPFNVEREYTARSTERSHRWLDRCLSWHAENGPAGQLARLRHVPQIAAAIPHSAGRARTALHQRLVAVRPLRCRQINPPAMVRIGHQRHAMTAESRWHHAVEGVDPHLNAAH